MTDIGTHTCRYVCFNNAMRNVRVGPVTMDAINQSNLSGPEKAKLKGWLLMQLRVEAGTPPRRITAAAVAAAVASAVASVAPAPAPAPAVASVVSPIHNPHPAPPSPSPPDSVPPLTPSAVMGSPTDFTEAELLCIAGLASASLPVDFGIPRRLSFEEPGPALGERLSFEEPGPALSDSGPIFGPASGGDSGLASISEDDAEVRIDLSNLSIEEDKAPSLSLLNAMAAYNEDDEEDNDDVVLVSFTQAVHNSGLRRPRVSFADSPPRIIGFSVAEGRSAADAIVLEESPPHKRNRAIEE
jgi:hypothetical protein